jgi:hypothetical protein
MIESGMLICKSDKLGTHQSYLGNFGMTLIRLQAIPDINNRPNKFLPSIIIRKDDRLKIINGRRDVATGKRESSEHSAKVTSPAKKHKDLPKLTLSSSSEEDKEHNDDDKNNDKDNDIILSKVGCTNDDSSRILGV